MSRLRQLLHSPGVIVLAGRAVAQGGFFVFTVAPSLVLADIDFNDLVISITILFLTVVAPAGAFQQHLLRQHNASMGKRDALAKALLLAIACSVVGSLGASLFVGWNAAVILLALGSVANVVSMLGASFHALEGRFVRSAVLDGISGITFTAASVLLVSSDAGIVAWSIAYLIVWLLSAALTIVGPMSMALRSGGAVFDPLPKLVRAGSGLLAIGVLSMAFNRADYLAMTLVATEGQSSRYALAGRFVGPIMIALGSLNNSLYVRQLAVRDDPRRLAALTAAAASKVGLLALVIVPALLVGVIAVGEVSASFGARDLVLPTLLLGLATVPFAYAIPYSYGFTAIGRERVWLVVLAGATLADLAVVLVVGHRGATATAAVWLATQAAVWLAVTRLSGRTASLRRSTATANT